MTRHLVTCLAVIAVLFVSPTPAAAAATQAFSSAVYDTVDAIEVRTNVSGALPSITVTGIISGQSAPSELTYPILTGGGSVTGSADGAARCDRLALLAMSKPGKFQLAMNFFNFSPSGFTCKLIVRTP
jgi:hypothetical protein